MRAPSFYRPQHHGQSLAEYALILALVAVASVGGLQALGNSVQATLDTAGTSIAGGAGRGPVVDPVVGPGTPVVDNPLQSITAKTSTGGLTEQSLAQDLPLTQAAQSPNPSETFAPPPEIR